MPAETAEGLGPCPQCGEKLRRWPTLDGSGHLVSCNACSYESSVGRLDEASTDSASQSTSDAAPGPARFRQLLAAQTEASPSDLPPDLLDELPTATRQALSSSVSQRDQDEGKLPDKIQQYLRQRGYFVSVEHGGPRLLSGGGRRPGSADLSPYELVRIASEMDEGVLEPERRAKCPHCQAVIAANTSHCPWCDRDFDAGDHND